MTKDKARMITCECNKSKRLSKMIQPYKISVRKKAEQKAFNCGEKCVNRSMNCECSHLSCPSQTYCTNRNF